MSEEACIREKVKEYQQLQDEIDFYEELNTFINKSSQSEWSIGKYKYFLRVPVGSLFKGSSSIGMGEKLMSAIQDYIDAQIVTISLRQKEIFKREADHD